MSASQEDRSALVTSSAEHQATAPPTAVLAVPEWVTAEDATECRVVFAAAIKRLKVHAGIVREDFLQSTENIAALCEVEEIITLLTVNDQWKKFDHVVLPVIKPCLSPFLAFWLSSEERMTTGARWKYNFILEFIETNYVQLRAFTLARDLLQFVMGSIPSWKTEWHEIKGVAVVTSAQQFMGTIRYCTRGVCAHMRSLVSAIGAPQLCDNMLTLTAATHEHTQTDYGLSDRLHVFGYLYQKHREVMSGARLTAVIELVFESALSDCDGGRQFSVVARLVAYGLLKELFDDQARFINDDGDT